MSFSTARLMDNLYSRCQRMVENRVFAFVTAAVVFANPFAELPQVIAAFTEPNVKAISMTMWLIFAAIQTSFVFSGIKTKNFAVFASMLVSVIESLLILITVCFRS